MTGTVTRRTIGEIRAEDARWKPGGHSFNVDALTLSSLCDNRGRRITRDHLSRVGMGDKLNERPICVGVIPRLTESLSVLYRVPATRRLKRKAEILADDDVNSLAFATVAQRMKLDDVWQLVDMKRNLLRQCVVAFVESDAHQSVQARVIEPFNVFRMPSAYAADVLDEDKAIALLIRDAPRPADCLFQLWQQEDDGWHCWITNEIGGFVGPQPYGEDGLVPFGVLPLLIVYDALPGGLAYLPIPESRLDFALNISALANDIAYLVKLEAHTIKAVTTADTQSVPTVVGPDKIWTLPEGSTVQTLAHTPHIADAVLTMRDQLAMLAMSESLPGDYFAANRKVHTGPALKAAERDLEARRQRQQKLAVDDERRAFEKIRAVHNFYAADWGLDLIDPDLELVASFGRQWQPVDATELQNVYFKDLAVGAASMIGYLQERYNLDRQGAIDVYKQIQDDRKTYPVELMQNPAALVDGPNAAFGLGGASKVPGAFNPDLATRTDGASVTDAVAESVAYTATA